MAALLIAVGGHLLQSYSSMLDSTHAYAPLKAVANDDGWGLIALAVGCVWSLALFLNGTFPPFRRISPWTRASCSLLSGSYHAMFASGMWLGNPAGDGFLMHSAAAVLGAVYCAIIAHEVKAVDKEAERCRHRRRPSSPMIGTQ